jgi:predicted HAD superfamily Cof-like phosphohydrolase
MSEFWIKDIEEMHRKYGVSATIEDMDANTLKKFLNFRISFLEEELRELKEAKTGDDVVDALIDLCVVAVGTLDAFNIDAGIAWDRVFVANMNKVVGVKSTRPNPLGLPDLVKPEGWKAPQHIDNVGLFSQIFGE